MPCVYDESPREREERHLAEKKKWDTVVRVACTALLTLKEEHPSSYKKLPQECKDWHIKHMKSDAARITQERKEKAAGIKRLEGERRLLDQKIKKAKANA